VLNPGDSSDSGGNSNVSVGRRLVCDGDVVECGGDCCDDMVEGLVAGTVNRVMYIR
jgi:hypothetical protein